MNQRFTFNIEQFSKIFPFYLYADKEGDILSAGKSLMKICDCTNQHNFFEYFSILRPHTESLDWDGVLSLKDQLVIIQSNDAHKLILRGQFEFIAEAEGFMFIGYPWFNSIEELIEKNYYIEDFALHDPIVDLLHALKSQEIVNNDLKKLVETINSQKLELELTNKAKSSVALFIEQNPDPQIKIDFDGEIISNNPAASKLDFIDFEGVSYRNDLFFKMLVTRMDFSSQKTVFEARSNEVFFSFVCVPIKEERSINIYGSDITQRKKDQENLEHLSLVASANSNGVFFMDTSGLITWVNEGMCGMTGYSKEEILSLNYRDLLVGHLVDNHFFNLVDSDSENTQEINEEALILKKDRSHFWGNVAIQVLRNDAGTVVEYFAIVQDIGEKRESEEKLKVLSQIAEDNLNPVIISDKDGRITWVNRSFVNMTGYSLEEVLGKKPGHLLQGAETDPKTVSYLKKQIKSGQPFNTEIINYSKTGRKYWLRILGQAIKNKNGEVTGYFALEEDITREKESEDRFRKALENISDNVWEHDFTTGKTYFSKIENEFLGYRTGELTNNVQLWWESVIEEDRKILEHNDYCYRNGLIESHSLEYRVRHKDGTIKWVLDRGVIIAKDRNGKPLRITGTHTDISGLYNTKLELSNRVKQFQSLSENIPGVLYEYEFSSDGSHGLRYVSPAIERIFGITSADFVNYLEYIHPDDRSAIQELNAKSSESLAPFYCEARLCVPGQPERWHSVHSSFSYYSETGSAVFTGVMLDITDRKQVQQELEAQREFYEGILNNMPADIAVFSPSNEYLFVNPRGISDPVLRKWIIGKRDEDYCELRNKPMSIAQERRKKFNAVLQQKKSLEIEERLITPQGKEQYVLRRWYPVLDKNDEVSIVIGYGIDITDRKLVENALRVNEEKYRSIIENMNLGLIEIDPEMKIVFANQTFMRMTGLDEQTIADKSVFEFLTEAGHETFEKQFAIKQNKQTIAYEVETFTKGKRGWWFVSSAPKYSSDNEQLGSIVICLDISKQKQLEHDLIRSREQAEQLARAKETFLANMSHEIRTPMNAIIGMGNQLAKTTVTDKQEFYIQTINNAAENLLVIINDILDLSKIEAGKLSIENIAFEPQALLQQAMQVVAYKAEEKGLWLTNTVYDTRISKVLIGDPYRFNQVLLNLLSNAVKFTENGGVDVRCEVVNENETAQSIRVSVDDTGIGMDPEFMDILFDKFSQEVNSGVNQFGGTGLGMSISKELVELMGGTIEVSSEKGVGSSISFVLELAKGSISDLQETTTSLFSTESIKGKTILVVDDNEMNRLVATTILEYYGVKLLEAINGEEAITLTQQENIDLILMDIQMPIVNGYDATKAIRTFDQTVPIIALTANAIKGENEKCLEVGMSDYITKPFKEEEFVNKIIYWLIGTNNENAKSEANRPKVNAALYSLDELKSISRGNTAFLHKMLSLFCTQSPQLISKMKDLLLDERISDISDIAHKLKPSVRDLRITELHELLKKIEKVEDREFRNGSLRSWIYSADAIVKEVVSKLKMEMEEF